LQLSNYKQLNGDFRGVKKRKNTFFRISAITHWKI
jgi:hypothetical protein